MLWKTLSLSVTLFPGREVRARHSLGRVLVPGNSSLVTVSHQGRCSEDGSAGCNPREVAQRVHLEG